MLKMNQRKASREWRQTGRTTEMNVYRPLLLNSMLLMVATISCAKQKGVQHLQAGEPQLKWKYETGGLIFSIPAVAQNTVYVGSCAGIFYAFNKDTGEVRWTYDIRKDGKQTSFHGNPLIAGDVILIGTDY